MADLSGTQGWDQFRDVVSRMESSRQLMSKAQKLKFAALRRAGDNQDIWGDWTPLVERAFALWESALGLSPGALKD